MHLPDFADALPALDLPFPEEVVSSYVVRSDTALAVFFRFHTDVEIPEHSHKGQWGVVIEGQLDLTMNGATQIHRSGSHYSIPSGTPHAAKAHAGSVIFDIFEEPDRYPVRAR
jgi:quercetin dioxygenase-like cupin family protein